MGLVPAQYELLFRLVAAGVLAVAPAALFVGLWRVLQRMRDDQLIERVLEEADGQQFGYGSGRTAFDPRLLTELDADGDGSPAGADAHEQLVPCGECGSFRPSSGRCPVCYEQ